MAMSDKDLKVNSSIYKYNATMKYVLGDTIIDIDSLQIKSIAIDSNYKELNMPMIFLTASIHDDYVDMMEENQNTGYFILSIKRAVSNSDMPGLFSTYIEDKFIYFITSYSANEGIDASNENQEADFNDPENKDRFKTISLGLLSMDHINKNKKVVNGIVSGNLTSIMYYLTGHLPILLEPPSNNKSLRELFLPPMNSVSKSLEYINSISVFYNTPYRFFIDFDCAYLLSSSGRAVKRKNENISAVFFIMRDDKDSTGKVTGMTTDTKKSMYLIEVDEGDFEVSDNHISGKSYSKVTATGVSGNTFSKSINIDDGFNVVSKTKNIRICNDNTGLLDNVVSSIDNSAIQLMVQKADIDSSVFTMNKEYIVQADESYDGVIRDRYDGHYILTRKRELYIRIDENFTMNTMLIFEKVPE